MKIKRKYIFITIILFAFLVLFLVGIYEWKNINNNNTKIDVDIDTSLNLPNNQIEVLQALVGLESKNMKILDNPLRVEGSFYIPEETVLSFMEHYLKISNNKEIENIQITINENGLTIGGQYKLLAYLKTPIDIDILPTLTDDNNIRLNLKDIRLLNLSLDDNIIDAIVESWFSDLDNITVDKGDVIIDKNFFKNTEINSITVEEDYLIINLNINLK